MVVPEHIHNLIVEYVEKHRPQAQPENEEYVFLTPGGRKVAHLSDELRALSKDFPTELGVIKVTATDMRKMTATEVAQTSGNEATVRNVASHMTHTAETAKRFYQHLQERERSVTAYTTINKNKRTLEEEEEDNLTQLRLKKPRQAWKEEEKDTLIAHFHLTGMSQAPKQEECGAFLMEAAAGYSMVYPKKKYKTSVAL